MSVNTSVHGVSKITTQIVLMDGLSTLDITLHDERGVLYRLVAFGRDALVPVMVQLPARDERREPAL